MWHLYTILGLALGAGILWTLVQILTMAIEIAACLADSLGGIAAEVHRETPQAPPRPPAHTTH